MFKSVSPCLKRIPLFGIIAMAVINGRDAAVGMVQYLADNQSRNTHGGHVGSCGASQVMRGEVLDTSFLEYCIIGTADSLVNGFTAQVSLACV